MVWLPERTRLLDIVTDLDAVDRRQRHGVFPAIFAQTPWRSDSPAVILHEESLAGRAASMPSHAYLLDVDVAAEVLEVGSSRRSGLSASAVEATEALIHYAAHGVHLPVGCHHVGCGRPGLHRCATCATSFCDRHAVVPGRVGGCPLCSPPRPVVQNRPGRAAPRSKRGLWGGLLVLGAPGLALGWMLDATAIFVGGACLVVIAGCVWLSGFVLRIMA